MTSIIPTALPNDPTLDGNAVLENPMAGLQIGRISVSDPDQDALTVSIVDAYGDTDLDSAFGLVYDPATGTYGLTVRDPSRFDFESTGGTLDVRIKVSDGTGATFKSFTINIADVNESPTDIALSSHSVAEHAANGTVVASLSGTDPDRNDVLTYTLKDAATSPFEIVQNAAGTYELRVKDGSLIDYATDPDHRIEATVVAHDSYGLTAEKTFVLDIQDVNSAPTDIQISDNSVRELAYADAFVGEFSATDPDSSETFSYQLVDDAGGRFWLDGNQLKVLDGYKIDFEQQRQLFVTVQVTDGGGQTFEKQFSISVRDVLAEMTKGSDNDDIFVGGYGNDILGGGKGNDVLTGGDGRDVLTGNEGSDIFVFNTAPSSVNRDTVVDFTVGEDLVHLKGSVFYLAYLEGGHLTADTFCVGTEAISASQRIIYDDITGQLYYDRDGSGTSWSPVEIATFSNKPALSASDFLVVA